MVISMLKIRRPLGRLIFNMGIAIPGKTVFLIETAPRCLLLRTIFWYWHESACRWRPSFLVGLLHNHPFSLRYSLLHMVFWWKLQYNRGGGFKGLALQIFKSHFFFIFVQEGSFRKKKKYARSHGKEIPMHTFDWHHDRNAFCIIGPLLGE